MTNISAKADTTTADAASEGAMVGIACEEQERLSAFVQANRGRQIVVVQGIGFVGTAMLAAIAKARHNGQPRFAVIGVDLPDTRAVGKVHAVRAGNCPIVSSDPTLTAAFREASQVGNMTATTDASAFAHADVVIVDINLDVEKGDSSRAYTVSDGPFRQAIAVVAEHIREDTLIIVETTVPPGTTERIVEPIVRESFQRRRLDPARVQIAHSYERVMPGPNYLSSITDSFRVFAANDQPSCEKARRFLEGVINTASYPLTELESTTASEMAKVLENTFRAVNIALIQEWTEFAASASVNLFQVLEAIRARPTHRNIMAPGFGVGGYCLTKDSLLADWAARNFFGRREHLNIALDAIDVNDIMPLHTLQLIKEVVPDAAAKQVAILGVSYLNDVADTRSSPTAILYDALLKQRVNVSVHDPLVSNWPERGIEIDCAMSGLARFSQANIVVFAVRHREYLDLDAHAIRTAFPNAQVVVDANNVLSDETARALAQRGITVAGVGKGHWRAFAAVNA